MKNIVAANLPIGNYPHALKINIRNFAILPLRAIPSKHIKYKLTDVKIY